MPSFDLLAPPFLAACFVLCATGISKVWKPEPTGRALRAVGLPGSRLAVRLLGSAEVAAATGGILAPVAVTGVAVGTLYVGFAAFLVAALARDVPVASCGCAGERDLPPSWVHVALDLTAAAAAFGVGASRDAATVGIATFVAHRPFLGVALAAGALLIAWLAAQVVLFVPASFTAYRGSIQR